MIANQKLDFHEIQTLSDSDFECLMRRTFPSDLAHFTWEQKQDIALRIAHLQKERVHNRLVVR